MTTTSSTLTTRLVETAEDVETLRLIRNACRDGFAHDNGVISYWEQREWWMYNQGRVHVWLFVAPCGHPAGFGMLRRNHDGQLVNSIAVLSEFRGRGYGKAIVRHLSEQTSERIVAEIRKDNTASQRCHQIEGWHLDHEIERLAVYVRPEVSGG